MQTALLKRRRFGRLQQVALSALAIATLGLLASAGSGALADGDPASDTLLDENVFYPYQPPVSTAMSKTMGEAVSELSKAGLDLKVAIIGSPLDLGELPQFFGHPEQYARFLDREISFNQPQSLLVVMPAGFGTVAAGPPGALAGSKVDATQGTYGLTRSAILAVELLARARGHPISGPPIPGVSAGAGGGPPALLLFGIPVALLIILGVLALRRDRRRAPATGSPS